MASPFEAGGFRDVDASDAPLAFSAHLDQALTYAPIVENRRLVRESLALASGQAVLDVGSGNGEEVREIATLVGADGRVVGIDLSAKLVDEARGRTSADATNVEFVVGDAHALPFEDGTFDAVRAERTLQHVDDPSVVVSEMARVTRSGGRVAVWEPDWGLLFVAASDQGTSARVCERVAEIARNPRIGRNLVLLFGQSGLTGISAAPRSGSGRPSRRPRSASASGQCSMTWSPQATWMRIAPSGGSLSFRPKTPPVLSWRASAPSSSAARSPSRLRRHSRTLAQPTPWVRG